MNPLELVLLWAGCVAAAATFLRWPGRTLGVVGALILWTVEPWASWAALCAVAAGVIARRVSGTAGGRGLLDHPPWAAVVLGSVVTLVGDGVVSLLGLAFVAGGLWWMIRELRATPATDRPRLPARVVRAELSPDDEGGGRDVWLVDVSVCERCGGPLIAQARREDDPARFVARASCQLCGLRLAGVLDTPRAPSGRRRARLVWLELPDGDREAG